MLINSLSSWQFGNSMVTDSNFNTQLEKKSIALMEESAAAFLHSSQFVYSASGAHFNGTFKDTFKDVKDKPVSMSELSQQKTCKKCHLAIDDLYIFNIKDTSWHEECLKCFECGKSLGLKCFKAENGALYCREDFIK